MMSVSVEMISPENLPSMRTVPSKSSLPSNWLPLPRSAFRSGPGRGGVGMVVTLDGAGVGIGGTGCCAMESSAAAPPQAVSGWLFQMARLVSLDRERGEKEQHQRLAGDESGGERGVVHLLGLRRDAL